MTPEEFSNGFDLLVSSYRRFRNFDKMEPYDTIEFDEYEKSFYLTKAQEELVLSLYTGRNSSLQGFEETEELRRYLSDLVCEADLSPVENSSGILGAGSGHTFFSLPDGNGTYPEVWFIIYESVRTLDGGCGNGNMMEVVPVTHDKYHRVKKNPFRGPNSRKALRLDLADGVVEIVCKYTVTNYYVRYLKKLSPIVLEQMPDGVTIEGKGTQTPCMLHEALHQKILELAVEMAMQSKRGSTTSAANNRKENS